MRLSGASRSCQRHSDEPANGLTVSTNQRRPVLFAGELIVDCGDSDPN
jgi:hypothetical protein